MSPLDRLTELFRRMRSFALTDPNRYRFLFETPMPWRSPRTEDAELTLRLLANAHGAIQAELTQRGRRGQTVDAEATVATMIRGLRPRRTLSSDSRR